MLQAQIGGKDEKQFLRNNVVVDRKASLPRAPAGSSPYVVHVSSSVVNSVVKDWYTETKRAQEELVVGERLPHCDLRPTLMFGWFDRKHLGGSPDSCARRRCSRFPGTDASLRQPLYERRFCEIVLACLAQRRDERGPTTSPVASESTYIDLIRAVKKASGARAPIVRIPYGLFWRTACAPTALFDRDPPFTTKQLEALVTPDDFEFIDVVGSFGVRATPLDAAVTQTLGRHRTARRAGILTRAECARRRMSRSSAPGAMGLAAALHLLRAATRSSIRGGAGRRRHGRALST